MSRYIDADALINKLDERCDAICQWTKKEREVMCGACPLATAFDEVENFPTADVVEVIRCEDCKHSHYFVNAHTDNYGTSVKAKVYCRVWQDWVPPEGYCFLADMRGEREDG